MTITAPTGAPLTDRELEVLRLAADGLSVEQTGRKLYLSADTVKSHLARAYRKLGVHDRTSAVVRALRLRLIELQGVDIGDPPKVAPACHPDRGAGPVVILRADDHDAALLASAWTGGCRAADVPPAVQDRARQTLARLVGTAGA